MAGDTIWAGGGSGDSRHEPSWWGKGGIVAGCSGLLGDSGRGQ